MQHKIVVGHAVWNDLKVLRIHLDRTRIRDTSSYVQLRCRAELPLDLTPSLKNLTLALLGEAGLP